MLFQPRGFLLILISVCFSMCIITSAAFTAPETFDSDFQKGKRYFNAGNYQEALRYLSEATRLDPKNQPAHSLAGVAYTKLGKWLDARREFEIVVRLNPNSPEASQAEKWLKRLQQPINVLILPFVDLSGTSKKSSGDKEWMFKFTAILFQRLDKYLKHSGLYNVIYPKKGSDLFIALVEDKSNFMNLANICQHAHLKGIKIIATGFVNNYYDIQTRPSYGSAAWNVTIKIYSTKDCRQIYSAWIMPQKKVENSIII